MFESDKNMLLAIDLLKQNGDIKFYKEAYAVMNLDTVAVHKIRKPDLSKYKQNVHFTAEHIGLFCAHFKINPGFIFGFEKKCTKNRRKIRA